MPYWSAAVLLLSLLFWLNYPQPGFLCHLLLSADHYHLFPVYTYPGSYSTPAGTLIYFRYQGTHRFGSVFIRVAGGRKSLISFQSSRCCWNTLALYCRRLIGLVMSFTRISWVETSQYGFPHQVSNGEVAVSLPSFVITVMYLWWRISFLFSSIVVVYSGLAGRFPVCGLRFLFPFCFWLLQWGGCMEIGCFFPVQLPLMSQMYRRSAGSSAGWLLPCLYTLRMFFCRAILSQQSFLFAVQVLWSLPASVVLWWSFCWWITDKTVTALLSAFYLYALLFDVGEILLNTSSCLPAAKVALAERCVCALRGTPSPFQFYCRFPFCFVRRREG